MSKVKPTWKEILWQAFVAAVTAAIAAIGTTSCMGYGPVTF
jgi:hypothetical protein